MNKFQTLSWLGATGLLLSLASCSNDEMPVPSGDKLTFTVSLPADAGTRAFSDGLQATNLNVAVYEAGKTGEVPLISTFPGGVNGSLVTIESAGPNKFTVTVPLARSAEYDVVFWAQSYDNDDNCPFTYNAVPQTVDVDYSKMAINNEASDAFYAKETGIEAGIAAEKDIVLHRPFAQVNIGAADYQEYTNAGGKGVTQTALTFTALPTTFDINKGTSIATENDADVTFDLTNVPVNETFPAENVSGVKYMAMAYVLAGSATSAEGVTDVTFTATNGAGATLTREYPSIPVQNNYRTNIYGRILTNINDFNVTINPIYAGVSNVETDEKPDVWDGKIVTPQQDEDGNYLITSAGEFVGLKNITTTPGTKVILNRDLDLNNKRFDALGTSSKPFKGEFNGNGHTISGLGTADGNLKGKLFNIVSDLNLHDLTVEAVSTDYSPVISQAGGSTRVKNVTVRASENETINYGTASGYGFGSIIATILSNSNVFVNDCKNYANIAGTGASIGGGLVGTVQGSSSLTISNSANYGNITAKTASSPQCYGVGGIVGGLTAASGTITINNCHNYGDINWTASRGCAGGILGLTSSATTARNDVTIKNCHNTGNITVISPSLVVNDNARTGHVVAAGIYGGAITNTKTYVGIKTIENCSNSGKISATVENWGNLSTATNVKKYPEFYGVYSAGIVGYAKIAGVVVNGCENSGDLSVSCPASINDTTPIQAMAGIINTSGVSAITLTNNVVTNGITMTGNHTPICSGIYNWFIGPSTITVFPANAVIEGNVNNSSYPVSNR